MLCCGAFGCGRQNEADHRAFTAIDPWYRPLPVELRTDAKLIPLDKAEFAVVRDEKQAEAQAVLKDLAWKELAPNEAEDLIGKPIGKPVASHLVLLRALSLNERNGSFDVSWGSTGLVIVHHGCLGRHPLPMTKRAILARLPDVPKEVYVHCSMAE
jgi:hypothetical protein